MKALLRISFTIIVAIFSVLVLAAFTDMFTEVPKNGFVRTFLETPTLQFQANRPKNLTSYIGQRQNQLYFSTKNINELYSCDTTLSHFSLIKLPINFSNKWKNNWKFFIQRDTLFCWASHVPALYKVSLETMMVIDEIKLPYPFSRAVPINPTSFLIRSSDPTDDLLDQVFMTYDFQKGITAKRHDISPIFNDAGMTTGGSLLFDTLRQIGIYVHSFSNQVVWFNANLEILKRTTTIDTSNHFGAKVESISTGQHSLKATFSAAPQIVNIQSTILGKYLINYSAKKSDNAPPEHFYSLDLYKMDGSYQGTISIPDEKDRIKFESFAVVNGKILTIYKKQLALYQSSFLLKH